MPHLAYAIVNKERSYVVSELENGGQNTGKVQRLQHENRPADRP